MTLSNKIPPVTRPAKGKGRGVEMIQLALPKPLPKGVSVVYDEAKGDYFVATSNMKATSALFAALWAGLKR